MSRFEAAAVAHPNIALAKYWGKRPGGDNSPAVPSLSVTLAGLVTRTRVTFDDALGEDLFELDGEPASEPARGRVIELLDRVRRASRSTSRAHVVSRNDFPTASGLASSASGFAALALAASRAAGLEWDAPRVSDLARRSSASAARSVFEGWVELDAGRGDDVMLAARPLAPRDHVAWHVLVAITGSGKKAVGSTEGMRATAERSPYYAAWLSLAPDLARRQREALLARDFERFGELAEQSAFAMHACAMAAGVVYWNGVTLEALRAVRELRAKGTAAFATIDAGPHVKVLVRAEDAALAGTWLSAVPGVVRVLDARPGEGARLLEEGP